MTTGTEFLDLEFPVEVWLAAERIPLEELLRLEPGGLLRLQKDPDLPVELVVNGTRVATGELVVVDSRFGFKVKTTLSGGLADLDGDGGNGADPEPAGEPDAPAAETDAPGREATAAAATDGERESTGEQGAEPADGTAAAEADPAAAGDADAEAAAEQPATADDASGEPQPAGAE